MRLYVCLLVLMFLMNSAALKSKMLRFQLGNHETYSTEEWAEFKGDIPHLNSFTACHWERLRFFSSRQSCQWSFCYKKKDGESSLYCIQLWYSRDVQSGGRYVRIAGGFPDKSNGGILKLHLYKYIFIFRNSDEEV